MRILQLVGARPQFVKLAPVAREIARRRALGAPLEEIIVHTGQHYDASMSDVLFEELDIPRPAFNLGVGSASHGAQTARMLEKLEPLLLELRPDVVAVYGDTNSTLAGALAATKLGIRVAHIEAGLRSFNRAMPEELNRVATDHLSDLLLAPTETAMQHLAREGLAARSRLVGDVMYDAALFNREIARRRSTILQTLQLENALYAVATIHRADNTEPRALARLMESLGKVATRHCPVVLPLHPRTRAALHKLDGAVAPAPNLRIIEPVSYLDMLRLTDGAALVLTDSGGLQKEAFILGCPCITLRAETEWTETVAAGANVLTGSDDAAIQAAAVNALNSDRSVTTLQSAASVYGDGRATMLVLDALQGIP